MILSSQDIENGTSYAFMLQKREKMSLIDLIDIAESMLAPYGEITDDMSLPPELALLYDITSNLNDRIQCFASIVDRNHGNSKFKCEEITIVDYGCGQGLASLCLLDWFSKQGLIGNIKQIKLVDKDKTALKRALLHFSVLFPQINVIAYEQDFLSKDFAIECNSIITINLFSHVLSSEFRLADNIVNLILRGHNLLMHNIILDEMSSRDFPNKLKEHYISYISSVITNKIGCELFVSHKLPVRNPRNPYSHKWFQYVVLSKESLLNISIPDRNDNFRRLCPGEPIKKLYNVPRRIMWYKQPLDNTTYCEKLDSINRISLHHKTVSPIFLDEWGSELDILNPKTIKDCAEKFYQAHICHALSVGLSCGQEIVGLYEQAAKDGITEAYNNLAILYFQNALGGETSEQKAIELCELAAEGGSDNAMMNLASYYMYKENVDEAISYYKVAADNGNAIALFNLALFANFGLYEQDKDLNLAEKLYRECLSILEKDKDRDSTYYTIQNSCCLNLMLLLVAKGEHYVKIIDIYLKAIKPSYELKYANEILHIVHENHFENDTLKILSLDNPIEKDKPYQKYNRAIFLYHGFDIHTYWVNVKLDQDIDTALDLMKSLADDENTNWEERDKYVYNTFATWTKAKKEKFGDLSEIYWRKAAECNPDYRCASLTNVANFCNISKEEKKAILKEFAFGGGCKHCHECDCYNETKRVCPKAQMQWADTYEMDRDVASNMIEQSASQLYVGALFHLGYRRAISENIPSFRDNNVLKILGNSLYIHPPKEYSILYPILAKDVYYDYLQRAADQNYPMTRSIIPFVAEQRADRYNYIYWASVFCAGKRDVEEKRKILIFVQSLCNRSLNSYFYHSTICEEQMIDIAEDIAQKTDDVEFICKVANFYYQGEVRSLAKKYYTIAKEKGAKDVDKFLDEINAEIKRQKEKSLEYCDENEPFESNWADYLSDAFEGDPGNMWNID